MEDILTTKLIFSLKTPQLPIKASLSSCESADCSLTLIIILLLSAESPRLDRKSDMTKVANTLQSKKTSYPLIICTHAQSYNDSTP